MLATVCVCVFDYLCVFHRQRQQQQQPTTTKAIAISTKVHATTTPLRLIDKNCSTAANTA